MSGLFLRDMIVMTLCCAIGQKFSVHKCPSAFSIAAPCGVEMEMLNISVNLDGPQFIVFYYHVALKCNCVSGPYGVTPKFKCPCAFSVAMAPVIQTNGNI